MIELIFPTVLHVGTVFEFLQKQKSLVNYVYQEQKKDPDGVVFSNRGGWQSKPSYNEFENPIRKVVIGIVRDYFGQGDFLDSDMSMNLVSLWMNINGKGSYNLMHDHPEANFSGVLWIKCPEDCGSIKFKNSHHWQQSKEINSYTSKFREDSKLYEEYYCSPEDGGFIIFPSHLLHYVETNESDSDRISISFNLVIT